MPTRLNLKTVNDELARRGHRSELRKATSYFYFTGGEAAEWVDTTVRVRTINTLTLKQWVEGFEKLKTLNEQILGTVKGAARPDRRRV